NAKASKDKLIQDVLHGNYVVSYIVASYEFGNPQWTATDIKKLAFTFTNYIYDSKRNIFKDNVDGSNDITNKYKDIFVGDGWAKIAKYDRKVKDIINKLSGFKAIEK